MALPDNQQLKYANTAMSLASQLRQLYRTIDDLNNSVTALGGVSQFDIDALKVALAADNVDIEEIEHLTQANFANVLNTFSVFVAWMDTTDSGGHKTNLNIVISNP